MNVACQQLELFPGVRVSRSTSAMDDNARDRRTEAQWLRSIIAYLEFRSGTAWRRLSNPQQRNHPERWWYLNGIRCVQSILAGQDPSRASIALVTAARTERGTNSKTDDLRVAKLIQLPRVELAKMLVAADPSKTDIRLLSHLPRPKLARLVVEAQKIEPSWGSLLYFSGPCLACKSARSCR